jgi:hypothetical protein
VQPVAQPLVEQQLPRRERSLHCWKKEKKKIGRRRR